MPDRSTRAAIHSPSLRANALREFHSNFGTSGDANTEFSASRSDHLFPTQPLHVVMRVAPSVGGLRRRRMYQAMRDATINAALREWFRIVHISLQRDHVHMGMSLRALG